MGKMFDKLMNTMRLNGDDYEEEYDDPAYDDAEYDDDDTYEDEVEEQPALRKKTAVKKTETTSFTAAREKSIKSTRNSSGRSNNIVPIKTTQNIQEVRVVRPGNYDTARENNLRLEGYSIDEENILSKFDTTYNDSKLIKGMKTTSKGFSTYSKVLSEEEINDMLDNTDKLIDKAIDNILEADFEINPKVINGENVSCSFCEYRDICYLREKDKVYINKDGEDNGD